jgi:phenylacetate-CoA ligase
MQYYPKIAFEPVSTQNTYQAKALKDLLVYMQRRSPFYKRLFDKHHINIHNVASVRDLCFLPTTSRADLQNSNWQFLCMPESAVSEYVTTASVTDRSATIALTARDIHRLAYSARQALSHTGGKTGSVYQLMLTLDQQIMSGLATYMGIRQLGATVVRIGKNAPQEQWDAMLRLQPDTAIAIPSFLLKLAEWAEDHGIDIRNSPVQKAICIDESIRGGDFELNLLGERIHSNWPLTFYSAYTATEIQTLFIECEAGMGMHHIPDLSVVEILNDHGNVLAAGEYGEVAITTLGVQGMPLLRYRTGDICAYYDSPCICGRHSRRLSPILARKQQMINYRGTTICPTTILNILNEASSINAYVVEVFTNDMQLDDICIHINTINSEATCENELRYVMGARLPELPPLRFHSKEMLPTLSSRNGAKAGKFVDRREIPG